MLGRSVPVFCYHDVFKGGGHSLSLFESHLRTIRDLGFTSISAREMFEICTGRRRLDERRVMLTFDDGHLSNWLHAAPLLREYGLTGVFFALADFVGHGPARDVDSAPPLLPMPDAFRLALAGDPSQFMNRAELTALVRDFGMEVHSHGRRHQACFRDLTPLGTLGQGGHWSAHGIYPEPRPELPLFETGSAYVYNGYWPRQGPDGLDFRRRSDAERRLFCQEDFRESLALIREINGGGPQFFCWPWGQFDALSEGVLRESGYAGAFTLERGPNGAGTDPFRLKRIGVGRTKTAAWVRARLRMYDWAPAARVFFKFYRKRFEPGSVLLATDSGKLSGGSRQMVNNAMALAGLGLRVTAAVPPGTPLAAALEAAGTKVIPWDDFRNVAATARFLRDVSRERGIDVVHAFHTRVYKPALLARLLGARFRLFINRGVVFKPNLLIGLWARLAQGMICNSRECARVLSRYGVPRSRLNVVYNSFVAEGGLPPDRGERRKRGLRIAYVGNVAPAKGFDLFLEAVQVLCDTDRAKDLEFVAVGVTPEDVERLAPSRAVRDRLHVAGHLPHAAVLRELAACDVLAITSRQESLPNVLLEAFAFGLAVVASRVGGVPELVLDGVNGLLCPLEDPAGLADRLHVLAGDPSLCRRMGRINRRLVGGLLDNRTKGRCLVRVYGGERLDALPPIAAVAGAEPPPDGEGACPGPR